MVAKIDPENWYNWILILMMTLNPFIAIIVDSKCFFFDYFHSRSDTVNYM